MTEYLYDNKWEESRERLQELESIEDQSSIHFLKLTSLSRGWHCLEIGGGNGSIVRWLCQNVGETGRVIATDIETRYLQDIHFPQLEVRIHDIAHDTLENDAFHLVHVRHVLIHIVQRENALYRIVHAVKPGGWVVIEESDFITNQAAPSNPEDIQLLYHTVMQEIYRVYRQNGMDLHYGMKVFNELRLLGMHEILAQGRMRIIIGGSDEALFHKRTYTQLKPKVLDSGRVSSKQYEQFLELHTDPLFAYHSRLTISTLARRP
jgi:2-polyprenyl-3-methyl-5-hydroxy-6-metoxy-1,4-benzoquinol methylase